MQSLKYLVCSLMLLIICLCETSNGQDCSSLFKKRGCYRFIGGHGKQLNHLLLNDRDGSTGIYINWKQYHTYLESLVCRCAKKASKEGYTTFGIQFWGECWGSKNVINEDSLTVHVDCANGAYDKCQKEDFICSGKAYTTHVYDVDECAAKTAKCDKNADCINSAGSFSCQCKDGYVGSGFSCKKSNDMFTKYDINADGQIDIEELRQLLHDSEEDLNESELKEKFNETDKDGSGFIDREEFSQLLDNKVNETRKKFKMFDKNGDGFIDKTEIKLALKSMGDDGTDEEVNELLQQADVDRDEKINYDEFVTAWLMMS